MMKKALAFIFLTASFSSHAGLFDSTPELKCGNDNAVTATKAWIYNEALGHLQQNYLTEASTLFFDIPLTQYEQQLRTIPIHINDVITKNAEPENANLRSCSAKISMDIPDPLFKVINKLPDTLPYISQNGGQFINTAITWQNVEYNIQFSDNGKDIVVTPVKKIDRLTWSIYVMARMSVSGDNLIKKKNNSLIEIATKKFESKDRELNQVWNSLPASSRAALKQQQREWINKKERECGKLSDAKSETLSTTERISIYQCQREMTNTRIAYLSSNELVE